MRDFRPQGQVTGIGSLPHGDADDAVRFVAAYSPAIPFWPQLPQRSEDEMMIPQMLAPLHELLEPHGTARFDIPAQQLHAFRQRLRETDAILDENSAAGFYAFERACKANSFTQASALKGQMTGPITLGHCLFVDDQPLAALPEIFAEFTDYLCRLGLWQLHRLSQFDKPVLLFVDEPALSLGAFSPSSLSGLQKLVAALHTAGAYVGVHCCAADLPDLICRVKPDIISFDAHHGLEAFLSNRDVQVFVEAGGWLAFGLMPTWNDLSLFDTKEALARLMSRWEWSRLASQTLITATCGLGLLNIERAQASFQKSQELARLVQNAAHVGEGL